MSTENASALAEGQLLPADNSQQNVTETENPEVQPEKTFTQAELDAIVQKRAAKAERKAEARYQELQREIQELKTPKAAAESNQSKAPVRGDFESYEDFIRADALHTARMETKKELEAFKKESKQEREETTKAKAAEKFSERVSGVIEAGQKAYPDFDAVVNAAVKAEVLPNRGPLYEAIMDSDIGEKLAYYLAHPKNEAEAERLQGLSVYAQLRELGKLEEKLSAKKEPRETMDPIAGRTSNASGLSDSLSMDAWVKQRNKQIKESR